MIKLIDLNPKWIYWSDGTGPIAIEFDCYVCKGVKAHKIKIDFANPFNGAIPVTRNHLWTVANQNFETISVSPSIDYTKYDNGMIRDLNCYHGFLQNGELT